MAVSWNGCQLEWLKMNKLKMNSIAIARQTFTMSTEDDREVHALTEWINALLSSPGLDVENSFEIERLLEKHLLPTRMTTPQKLNVSQRTNTPQKLNTPQRSRLAAAAESMHHIDLSTLRQKRLNEQWRHKATNFTVLLTCREKSFNWLSQVRWAFAKDWCFYSYWPPSRSFGSPSELPSNLVEACLGNSVRRGNCPSNELNCSCNSTENNAFCSDDRQFYSSHLFTSEALVKRGRSELVAGQTSSFFFISTFLSNLCQIFFVIESMVTQAVVPNIPCMFLKSSQYKCMQDVYGYLSREVIAGSTNLPKMLARVGFEANYKQGFFEEYDYHVEDLLADLSDGIILARVIETLTVKDGHLPGDLISKLRNPSGDRIRKIYNVRMVLTEAVHRFPTKFHGGEVKAEDIVAAKRSVIVKFVLQLADIQEATAVVKIQAFLCTELRRRKGQRKCG
uniref:Calponin-homology (CH) domain-containing protein n=1 Tax=Ditylenchus dipsaci TaxID=166011 RepID=A0A915EGT8_9BILA